MQHPIRNIALVGLGIALLSFAFPAHNGVAPPEQTFCAWVGLSMLCLVPFGYCLWSLNRGINENVAVLKQGIPDPPADPSEVHSDAGQGADRARGCCFAPDADEPAQPRPAERRHLGRRCGAWRSGFRQEAPVATGNCMARPGGLAKGKGMSSKQRLVYGIINDNLVLMPEDTAKAFAAEHQAIWSLKTYGEARRFQPQSLNGVPGLDEDEYDEIPADEDPYDVALTNDYENGDWPPQRRRLPLTSYPTIWTTSVSKSSTFPGSRSVHRSCHRGGSC